MHRTRIKIIEERDAVLAWNWIEKFKSVPFTTNLLEQKHKVPAKHRNNVKKQAEQIRYCIQQAREYFEASKAVSLSTRPLLLYYSCMSLALAEILVKQDGTSSLDVARQKHRHHGLLFTENFTPATSMVDALNSLRARPMLVDGVRTGTFELWRKTSRYASVASEKIIECRITHTTTKSYEIMLAGSELPEYPEPGLTLFDCFTHFPRLNSQLHDAGISYASVRGDISTTYEDFAPPKPRTCTFQITVHPDESEKIWKVFEHFKTDASAHSMITVKEVSRGGFILQIKMVDRWCSLTVPEAIQEKCGEMFFHPPFPLNEFGIIYVGLYILGNFARYFPDKWMHEVEQSSEFAVLVESFLNVAQLRMPLLFLSEVADANYFIDSN